MTFPESEVEEESGSGAEGHRGGSGSDRDGSPQGDISFTANVPDQPDIYIAKRHQVASSSFKFKTSVVYVTVGFMALLLMNLSS